MAATVVARALSNQGFTVTWQCHLSFWPVLKRAVGVSKVEAPGSAPHINLDGAYEKDARKFTTHLQRMFWHSAKVQFPHLIWWDDPPTLRPDEPGEAIARDLLRKYPSPWVLVCPRSEHYVMRQVPDGVWSDASKLLPTQVGGTMFWIGIHPGPAGIVDLRIRSLEMLIAFIGACDLLVTVDTGPLHLAAALGKPIVAISQAVDAKLRLPLNGQDEAVYPDHLDCLNCQLTLCPINNYIPPCQNVSPQAIVDAIQRRFSKVR